MSEENINEALTLKKVAEFFDVTPRTIRLWLKKDENFPRPFKKFGTLRFKRSEVEWYWKENRYEGEGNSV